MSRASHWFTVACFDTNYCFLHYPLREIIKALRTYNVSRGVFRRRLLFPSQSIARNISLNKAMRTYNCNRQLVKTTPVVLDSDGNMCNIIAVTQLKSLVQQKQEHHSYRFEVQKHDHGLVYLSATRDHKHFSSPISRSPVSKLHLHGFPISSEQYQNVSQTLDKQRAEEPT